jgi:hypothetical protein
MQYWYVYYKVGAAEADAICARVRKMIESLPAGAPRARLLRRADGGDEVTLMEVYEPVADARAFAAVLAQAWAASGLPPELLARRRVERFEDL